MFRGEVSDNESLNEERVANRKTLLFQKCDTKTIEDWQAAGEDEWVCSSEEKTKKRTERGGNRSTRRPRSTQTDNALFVVSDRVDDERGCTYHLKRPNSPDPHLEFALNSTDIVELDALPPASSRGFPPKEKELLSHADCVAVGEVVALDIRTQTSKCNAADNSLVRLASAMSPAVIVVESTDSMSACGTN